VGWFSDLRQQRAEEAHRGARARWEDEREELADMVELARDPHRLTETAEEVPIILRRGESVLAVLHGSTLVESRRGAGRYTGGSQGFSFRVAKGVNYRVGATRGTFQQGEERLTAVDTGSVTVTSRRIVFQGDQQAREWALSKVLGIQDDPTQPLSLISVSNRQKVSGFTYDEPSTPLVRFRLALAVAMATDTLAELVEDLEEQLAELDAERPRPPGEALPAPAGDAPPAPAGEAPVPHDAPPPTAPAGWYADPADHTRWRWWDGRSWTGQVHEP